MMMMPIVRSPADAPGAKLGSRGFFVGVSVTVGVEVSRTGVVVYVGRGVRVAVGTVGEMVGVSVGGGAVRINSLAPAQMSGLLTSNPFNAANSSTVRP